MAERGLSELQDIADPKLIPGLRSFARSEACSLWHGRAVDSVWFWQSLSQGDKPCNLQYRTCWIGVEV